MFVITGKARKIMTYPINGLPLVHLERPSGVWFECKNFQWVIGPMTETESSWVRIRLIFRRTSESGFEPGTETGRNPAEPTQLKKSVSRPTLDFFGWRDSAEGSRAGPSQPGWADGFTQPHFPFLPGGFIHNFNLKKK